MNRHSWALGDRSIQLRTVAIVCAALSVVVTVPENGHCQQTCRRILIQDSTLNNFVDPPGYRTGTLGELGNYKKVGSGPQPMILIPGLGFGADVFDEFMSRWGDKYTMYAVTLAGFGGTPAPPSPATNVSFGEQTWTNGAMRGLEKLIAQEGIKKPILVGHWATGTQLALRLALAHPENARAVIILSGSSRFVMADTARMPLRVPLDKRIAAIDRHMAPSWYATVTRETWDDNNFLPIDYAISPVRGLRLWREAAEPPIHVWVRYLCEFYAQDITLDLARLTIPTLIVKPGHDPVDLGPGQKYMDAWTHLSWQGIPEMNPKIQMAMIPDSRVCLWFDQPEKLDAVVGEFLRSVK
ncbi:MAG: alpha/beta hydrolase [candidate division Zixibacteria bacterium]|nr:alpha/beta hydrolase [candidate division Zixibacteria bacterium]